MIKKIKFYLNEIATLKFRIEDLQRQVTELGSIIVNTNDFKSPKINLGQIQSQINSQKDSINSLAEVEFQVFSQFGDDGIIQYLISKLDIPKRTFIEFGVEDYKESNTRFLLINNNWSGFLIDGSKKNVEAIKNDSIYWATDLKAEAEFIRADNINGVIRKSGFDPEVGILSIDIDGNDYWVWKAITEIKPVIVIVEYNSLFGKNNAWTVPYDPTFVRGNKNSSIMYFGASLKALEILGNEKGYSLIGSCSKGLNAYFIRNDKLGNFKAKVAEDCYVFSKFREGIYGGERITGADRIKAIEGLEVVDVLTNTTLKIQSSLIQYQI